jgi:hypothetical protein
MTATLLAVPETDQIAALLAELAGRPSPPQDFAPAIEVVRESAVEVTMVARRPRKEPESAKQLLQAANWRNEEPSPVPPVNEKKIEAPATETEIGPLPAPFGARTVSALFGLVNWRNRTDEVRPLPLIKPPPPPGSEFTVEAMISTFGWE